MPRTDGKEPIRLILGLILCPKCISKIRKLVGYCRKNKVQKYNIIITYLIIIGYISDIIEQYRSTIKNMLGGLKCNCLHYIYVARFSYELVKTLIPLKRFLITFHKVQEFFPKLLKNTLVMRVPLSHGIFQFS